MCDCFTCVGDGAAAEEEEEEEEEEPGQPINEAAAIRLQSGVSRTALSALLQQMPALSEADIEQCLAGDPAVLDCAALPPALTCLSLRGNDLTALPDGPYPPGGCPCFEPRIAMLSDVLGKGAEYGPHSHCNNVHAARWQQPQRTVPSPASLPPCPLSLQRLPT